MTERGSPAASTTRRLRWDDLVWLAGIALVALILRLAWVLYADADPTDGRFDDSVYYHLYAISVSDGHGYNNAFTGLATAQWPPGYPFFLAGLYWLFGPSVVAAKMANVLLGAATAGLVYALALRLLDRSAARVAALLFAVFPSQILFASLVYSETLFTFLFVLGLLLIAIIAQHDNVRPAWLVGFGLVAGTTALTREAGLGLLVIAALYWGLSTGIWRRALGWTAVAVVASLALILPWTVRNAVQLDSPILISSTSGTNFWQGHHEGAQGGFDLESVAILREETAGGEGAANSAGYRRGLRFALTHPIEEAKVSVRKLRIMYQGDAIGLWLNDDYDARPFMSPALRRALRAIATTFYYGVLAFALAGCVRLARARKRAVLLPLIAIFAVTMGTVAFFAQQRYHYPLVPIFCVPAAAGLVWLWEIVREWRPLASR